MGVLQDILKLLNHVHICQQNLFCPSFSSALGDLLAYPLTCNVCSIHGRKAGS